MTEAVLSVSGLAKSYPGVLALRDVSFSVQLGSVHALLGENGAGKSTLIRVLSGVEPADAGIMKVDGRLYRPSSPLDALRAGVSTLYQEQNLLPNRTVVDNVLMTGQPRRLGVFLDRRRARGLVQEALVRVGADNIDPDAVVGRLSVADRQMVDIARALHRDSRLLIMDEPTAALSSREVDGLFDLVSTLPARGVSVVFVSHRMDEIFRICDDVTVLRDGEHVQTTPIGELTSDRLVRAMVGGEARTALPPRAAVSDTTVQPALFVRGLSGPGFAAIDLKLAPREILAVAGVTGSGKEQLGEALLGAVPARSGTVEIHGCAVRLTPRRVIAAGMVGVPADRKRDGVIGALSVRRNLALPSLSSLSRLGFVSRRYERRLAENRIGELAIKVHDPTVPVAQLSGGNQQKVALGKWLERPPHVLVLLEPTQGIDIKVRYEFYRLVRRLADEGCAVLLVSSDIPEVLTLADRIIVLRHGSLAGELVGAEATGEAILRLSLGQPGAETEDSRQGFGQS